MASLMRSIAVASYATLAAAALAAHADRAAPGVAHAASAAAGTAHAHAAYIAASDDLVAAYDDYDKAYAAYIAASDALVTVTAI